MNKNAQEFKKSCRTRMTMEAVQKFKDRKPEVYALFNEEMRLNDRTRKNALRYLDEFYAVLDSPELFSSEITGRCRG